MLTAREVAIVDVAVNETRQTMADQSWRTWRRRAARSLSCVLMIWGIESFQALNHWYFSLPIWIVVAFVAEWGWCGKIRDWDGIELDLRPLRDAWRLATRA